MFCNQFILFGKLVPECHFQGPIYDIQNINIAVNNYLQSEDVVD